MDNAIEFRTSPKEAADLRERLKEEIDWLEICGWEAHHEKDQIRLTQAGRADVIIRNGVIHHG